MKEPWRTIFLLFVILFAFGMTKACDVEADKGPFAAEGYSVELVASLEDGDVNTYRIKRDVRNEMDEICWVTVGELHGKTVAMECK
jgi:hypothetical protein